MFWFVLVMTRGEKVNMGCCVGTFNIRRDQVQPYAWLVDPYEVSGISSFVDNVKQTFL